MPAIETARGAGSPRTCPRDGARALIHNDYKYDNVVLDPADLARIVAVLDWEMATIGDPLDGPRHHARATGSTRRPGRAAAVAASA